MNVWRWEINALLDATTFLDHSDVSVLMVMHWLLMAHIVKTSTNAILQQTTASSSART